MPELKPRRSIFDTLKKTADARLGLAEAARMADKISVFPVVKITADPISDPTTEPTKEAMIRPSDPMSDHPLGHDPTSVETPVGSFDPRPEPTNDPTKKPDPTNDPSIDPTVRNIFRGLTINKRRFLRYIIENKPTDDDYIISRQEVIKNLHLSEISVKRYFDEFAKLGFFKKETYRHGVCQGVRLFLVQSKCRMFKQLDPTNDPTHKDEPTHDPTTGPTSDPTPLMKIDRKNLSISLDVIRTTWPNLSRSGFGVEQVDQIVENLTATGKPTDRIVQGLDHLEYELANDQLVAKDGQPVADPCSWAFRALAQNGYYRRPKGYVSPEEQAAKDAEEEARAVITARQKAEQVRFEAWRDGLSPDELTKALKGHPGGPRDAWLKTVWKKILTKE